MSDLKSLSPLILLALGAGALLWFFGQEGKPSQYNVIDGVWSDLGYNPYAWWAAHQENKGIYTHVYPEKCDAGCMPTVIQNEEGALSTTEATGKGVPHSG